MGNECKGTWCGADSNETAALVQSKIPEPATESSSGCCYEDGCQSCNPASHYCDSNDTCSNECKGTWCGADSNQTAALVSKIPEPANESSGGCCHPDGKPHWHESGWCADTEYACVHWCHMVWSPH